MVDGDLVVYNGYTISMNSTISNFLSIEMGLQKKKEENSNLDLIQRCLSFQDSDWSHRSKWKSRVEGGAAPQGEVSLCVYVSDLYMCVSLLQLHSLQSQLEFQEQSMVEKSLVCRQEAKIREVETKLEYERTQIKRLEVR